MSLTFKPIICIETSTSLCSVALCSQEGEVLEYRESAEPRSHASQTSVLVQSVLEARDLAVSDCCAVALSSGPGSYTGLRVGSSTAKGLCFGAGIPLISIPTTDILAVQALEELPEGCTAIVPMIDARRMEVYCAEYSPKAERLSEVKALVVEPGSFPSAQTTLFIGDGAEKCRQVLGSGSFVQCCPKASAMAAPASSAFAAARFEDVAYFEPFYLKEFVATVSKKNLF